MEQTRDTIVRRLRHSPLPAYWTQLLDLLFPPLCHCCRAFLPDPGPIRLCPGCLEKAAAIIAPLCSCCGRPFATEGGMDHLCGNCILTPPPFVAARSALRYEQTVRELIHSFKYGYKVQLRRPLGLLAAARFDGFVSDFGADLILPVPLHVKRLRQRGFNQALLLAELFSHRWEIPLCRNNLRRIRWTEPQVNLSAHERADNVKGAFSLKHPEELAGKRVLLVDDVYTTGSTVKECCRSLREAGAATAVLTVAMATE